MQISKIAVILLTCGLVSCSSANSASLPNNTQSKPESKSKLVQANLKNADEYFNRANKRLEKGDLQGAIDDLNQVIKINPKLASAYYNRAVARGQLQDNHGAIADFIKVIH